MTPDQAPEDPTATPTPETTPEPTPEPAPVETPAPVEAAPAEEPAPAVGPLVDTAPAAGQSLFENNKPAGEKKSHTGLIIGIIAGVVVIAVVLIVVFAVILPNANKGKDGDKKDNNTSQNGGKENGGNGGNENGGNGGENGGNGGNNNGGENGGNGGNKTSNAVVGTYEIYSVIGADGKEDTQSIAFIKAMGGTYTVEFRSNGTGEIAIDMSNSPLANMGDEDGDDEDGVSSAGSAKESAEFTWKEDGTLSAKDEEDDTIKNGTWSLSDDKNYVSISMDGETMKFKRM